MHSPQNRCGCRLGPFINQTVLECRSRQGFRIRDRLLRPKTGVLLSSRREWKEVPTWGWSMALSSPHGPPPTGLELCVSLEVSPVGMGTLEGRPALTLRVLLDLAGLWLYLWKLYPTLHLYLIVKVFCLLTINTCQICITSLLCA